MSTKPRAFILVDKRGMQNAETGGSRRASRGGCQEHCEDVDCEERLVRQHGDR